MDVEVVHKATGKSRFEKALAVLVGITAIMASLLATLEMHSNKNWERSSTAAANLSVELFGKIAATGPVDAAGARAEQAAYLSTIESSSRANQSQNRELEVMLAYVDSQVGSQLLKLAKAISAAPGDDSDLDPVAREVITTDIPDLTQLASLQREQVEDSDRYGSRLSRALF